MLLELDPHSDIYVLRLHGRFATGRDSGYLLGRLDDIRNSSYSKFLADFANVEYIDSTGLGFVVGLYTSITKKDGGRFVLANVGRRVREVLELTRLAEVLPIYSSEEAALEALRQTQKSATTHG